MAEYAVRRSKCRGCRRCLRVCPTKAVWFTGGRAHIYEESCVSCGRCLDACRWGAVETRGPWEVLEIVLGAPEVGGRAVAVLESSFAGYFWRVDPGQVVAALAAIGFASVWDTSAATHAIASWFSRQAPSFARRAGATDGGDGYEGHEWYEGDAARDQANGPDGTRGTQRARPVIVTECPVVGSIIEVRFPMLAGCLLQPASAAELTAALIRKHHPDAVVAVFSPCRARQAELRACQPPRCADAAFTFSDLEQFLVRMGRGFSGSGTRGAAGDGRIDGEVSAYGRLAAGRGGYGRILRLPRFASACGVDEVMGALDLAARGELGGVMLVLQACPSCSRPYGLGAAAFHGSDAAVERFSEAAMSVGGSTLPTEATVRQLEDLISRSVRDRRELRESRSGRSAGTCAESAADAGTRGRELSGSHPGDSSQPAVERALRQMGKASRAQEIDCGACGYDSCREQAAAAAEGRDDGWRCPITDQRQPAVMRGRGEGSGRSRGADRGPVAAAADADSGSVRVVAYSVEMGKVLQLVSKVAAVGSTVLITGESGVGKEVVARLVHTMSERKGGPFIKINCGAIPDTLLESELFGYEAGAFTGARREGKPGLIELANGGTLFLDEIPELPLPLQVKLLQVIQEKRLVRIGGTKPIDVDARIVAATNRDIREMVNQGLFRSDLYYRLNVVPIVVPPLRERKDDIIPLVYHFLDRFGSKYGAVKQIDDEAKRLLCDYSWPGNVRELENTIERLVVTVDEPVITGRCLRELMPTGHGAAGTDRSASVTVVGVLPLREAVREVERQILANAARGDTSTHKIARLLGVNQSTVVRKLKRLRSQ